MLQGLGSGPADMSGIGGWVVVIRTLQAWLSSRVVSVLDRAQKTQVQNAAATLSGNSLIGKLFTPIVPLFTKQQN